jgi:CheY-like chemotaxis protein
MSAAVSPEHLRVLVVDDREDCRASLAQLLSMSGFDVRVACNGGEALAVAAEYLPEAVLLDIGLPDISGYDVAAALRANPATSGAFIAAVSGYGRSRDQDKAARVGIDKFFVKPAAWEDLEAALRNVRPSTELPKSEGSAFRRCHTVLVVDDDPVHRYVTSRVLRAVGYKVREAPDGVEAMQRTAEVAAVVLDVCLPDVDGWEICRRLRAATSTSSLPVLHYSALYGGLEARQRSVEVGGNAFLASPAPSGVLTGVVDALIAAAACREARKPGA